MHKEKLVVDGKEIEVDTFDTVIQLSWSKKRILRAIGKLIEEDEKYKQDKAQKQQGLTKEEEV